MPRTNKAAYDLVLRGLTVGHSTDSKFMWACHSHKDLSVQIQGDIHYVFTRLDKLQIMFFEKLLNKKPIYHFSLSDSDFDKGIQLRAKFNIPESAPIVVLHARESGYLGDSHSYRNASIENYIPAINYLINNGFYIVRIGDKSMKRFVNPPPQLIDAPFHPEYTDFVEPYFAAVSKFFIGSASGPDTLALTFATPLLCVNLSQPNSIWGSEKDLFLPKKVYSHKLKRYLTYEEFWLSPGVNFHHTPYYQQAGIEFKENSSEEILMAVKEMDARIDGTYSSSQEIAKFDQRVRTIYEKAYYYRKYSDVCKPEEPPCVPYLSNIQMSNEFIKANPEFLGHEWPSSANEFAIAQNKNQPSGQKAQFANPDSPPQKVLSLNKQGMDLFNKGDVEGASHAFKKAIELAPANTAPYDNLGVVYFHTGKLNKALRCFAKALSIDPNDQSTTFNCCELLKFLKKNEEAKTMYISYLKRNPGDTKMINALKALENIVP